MDFILENWAEIALAVIAAAGTITALTSTTKDDNIVDLVKRILQAIILGKSK
jgi:energy-coupling factor transporter transmembrane protein EcfT